MRGTRHLPPGAGASSGVVGSELLHRPRPEPAAAADEPAPFTWRAGVVSRLFTDGSGWIWPCDGSRACFFTAAAVSTARDPLRLFARVLFQFGPQGIIVQWGRSQERV